MAKQNVSEIVAAMVANFGGQEVPNAELKRWLVATFPSSFPSGRADGFIEFIAAVDFATTAIRGDKPPKGYAILKGIKRERSRFWLVPSVVPDTLAPKGEVFGRMGMAVPSPLPTKKRTAIRFGEYVAAKRGLDEGEGE